jgi:hypothetical protein
MEKRTTVERRTTVVPDPVDDVEKAGSTNVNIDPNSGVTNIQRNEPERRETTVRETTVERTTRSS